MLVSKTADAWVGVALASFDDVLVDHAHCEKKAASQSLSLVAAHPEHERLVRGLTALAIEELRHFRDVYALLRERGLALGRDAGDPYARALQAEVRSGGPERSVDRLLVAGLIEARSHERLLLLADALAEPELRRFYARLAKAEAGHATLFVDLAELFRPRAEVEGRLRRLAEREAAIVDELPTLPRIH